MAGFSSTPVMWAAGGASASEARPPPQPTSSTVPSTGRTSRSSGVDGVTGVPVPSAVKSAGMHDHGDSGAWARISSGMAQPTSAEAHFPARWSTGTLTARSCPSMEMHFATVWEAIADELPDTRAIVQGSVARTWREYDDRAARLASAFVGAGLAPDSKVGLFLFNSNEYLEAQYGAFKMRGVPVNVNYRYLDDELWYLLDNADAEALVFHTSLSDRVARVQDRLPDAEAPDRTR